MHLVTFRRAFGSGRSSSLATGTGFPSLFEPHIGG